MAISSRPVFYWVYILEFAENSLYYLGAFLLFIIGFAHSYLGERLILNRLFKDNNLSELLGGTEFTKSTLRFA